jgi:hypothetical protein
MFLLWFSPDRLNDSALFCSVCSVVVGGVLFHVKHIPGVCVV